MIRKNVDEITEDDLQALVDDKILERKTMEYKLQLPGNSDHDKREFLADVSSFANASGGDLIYGIVEDKKTGKPKSLDGLAIENVDQEISRLDSMIRTAIAPRMLGTTIKPINLSNSKTALVIRVPKSWISPHRVTFKGHDKFYSRSTNGKYPMDVGELRTAFNLSETTTERIRGFREDRIANIFANETPVPFHDNPKIVLHLIPIISFNPAQSYDISKIVSDVGRLRPIYSYGGNNRYNLDGFLAYSRLRGGKSHSYVQLFKNGIVEAVEGLLLEPERHGQLIPSIAYEKELIQSLREYLAVLEILNVDPPIFVFLTLLGARGYSMPVEAWRFSIPETHPIDRDILLLPESVIETYDVAAEQVLRPSFDSIWNACGFPGSLNYNDSGNWVPWT